MLFRSQLKVRIGGQTVGAQSVALAVAANDTWKVDCDAIFGVVGAGGTFSGFSHSYIGHDAAGTYKIDIGANKATALDTTASRDVDILVDFAAGAGVTIDLYAFDVQIIHKA